jgi:hypothetical protein
VTTTIINRKKAQKSTKCADCVLLCGNKIAGDAVPGIVIALKRNGAYADNIQVQQLGSCELFES